MSDGATVVCSVLRWPRGEGWLQRGVNQRGRKRGQTSEPGGAGGAAGSGGNVL